MRSLRPYVRFEEIYLDEVNGRSWPGSGLHRISSHQRRRLSVWRRQWAGTQLFHKSWYFRFQLRSGAESNQELGGGEERETSPSLSTNIIR
jgi:hypothetical protein